MKERRISDLDQECEGIELLDDVSGSSRIEVDSLTCLQHARLSYQQAWNRWFFSCLETTARKAVCGKLRLANWLAPYVLGVPVWPAFVIYVVLVAGLIVLAAALPIDFSWLPWIFRIGLMVAGLLIPVVLMVLVFLILREAKRDPQELNARFEKATQEYEQSRKLHLTIAGDKNQARAHLRTAKLQAKSFQRNQAESQRPTHTTLSELSRFTASLRWRYLTGETWEAYLEQIFLKHGYRVERTKVTGDQGVDLIVTHGHIRLAVQAKGYAGSVGNKSVQEVVAGRMYYRCTHSAVITNSSFTKSARELAGKTQCYLIDGSEIERLHSHGLKHIIT